MQSKIHFQIYLRLLRILQNQIKCVLYVLNHYEWRKWSTRIDGIKETIFKTSLRKSWIQLTHRFCDKRVHQDSRPRPVSRQLFVSIGIVVDSLWTRTCLRPMRPRRYWSKFSRPEKSLLSKITVFVWRKDWKYMSSDWVWRMIDHVCSSTHLDKEFQRWVAKLEKAQSP